MWRGRFFKQDSGIPRVRSRGRWITILAIALLVGVAWNYGIITSAVLLLKSVVIDFWNTFCDVAAACRDFWHYVLGQWHH